MEWPIETNKQRRMAESWVFQDLKVQFGTPFGMNDEQWRVENYEVHLYSIVFS